VDGRDFLSGRKRDPYRSHDSPVHIIRPTLSGTQDQLHLFLLVAVSRGSDRCCCRKVLQINQGLTTHHSPLYACPPLNRKVNLVPHKD